ncbi:MAG: hypothetical protein L6M37_03060 [Candidatus Methylarchaceae archaeon HK02M1]|nr:hypothetical protein [Candidatus Methylarchaceae archaeon HK02M1]
MKARYLVETFKFPSPSFKPKRVPTKEELAIFYNHLEGLDVKAFFLICATSGLRRNEVLFLNRAEIDLESWVILPKEHITYRSKKSWLIGHNI